MKRKNCRIFGALACAAAVLPLCAASADEPPEEIKVVYPASTASRTPIVVGPTRSAASPTEERGELDVDTPLGQIAAVQDALDEIRASQSDLQQAFAESADRVDAALAEREETPTEPRREPPRWAEILAVAAAIALLAKTLLPNGLPALKRSNESPSA